MCFLEIPYFFPTTNCWHLGCICLIFLHCAFSNVFSNCLNQRMHNHTGCICATFLRCVISDFSPGHSLFHSENLLYRHCSQWTQNIEGFYLPYFFGGERLYSPYLCTFVWVVTFYDKKYDSAGKKKWKCFVTLNHLSVSKKKRKWTIKPVETKKTLSKKEKSGKKTEQGTPANLQLAQRQHWGGRSIHWLSRGGERRFIFFWWGFWWRGFWRWVQTLPLVPKSSFFPRMARKWEFIGSIFIWKIEKAREKQRRTHAVCCRHLLTTTFALF